MLDEKKINPRLKSLNGALSLNCLVHEGCTRSMPKQETRWQEHETPSLNKLHYEFALFWPTEEIVAK